MSTVNVEKQPLLSGAEDGGAAKEGRKPILGKTGLVILYYAACSSTMLVINKVAVHAVPLPSFVLFCQLACSALAVWVLESVGMLQSDRLEWDKVCEGCFTCACICLISFQHAYARDRVCASPRW